MTERTRAFLRQEFSDGERPTGADFADLIESFINKEDDEIRLVDGNLSVPAGLTLQNATTGAEGTLRYTGTAVEVFQGGVWNPVGGGGGAFEQVDGGPNVAFAGGNVGIGDFSTPPAHRLDVPLEANAGPEERVRFGNLVVHNGEVATDRRAYVSHLDSANDQEFALRQDEQGNTDLNCGPNASLAMSQGGTERVRISGTGALFITPTAATIQANTSIVGNLNVTGQAFKPGGGPFQPTSSDKRVKRDVRPLKMGLKEIRKLKPVHYKYNGKAGTPNDDREYVGMVAQDVAKVVPFMVEKSQAPQGEDEIKDLLTLDTGPLTFILVNAVRELAERVEALESQLRKNGQ